MLNGRDDFLFFRGSKPAPAVPPAGYAGERQERHLLYEGAHNIYSRLNLAKDMLDWLDRYLGPRESATLIHSPFSEIENSLRSNSSVNLTTHPAPVPRIWPHSRRQAKVRSPSLSVPTSALYGSQRDQQQMPSIATPEPPAPGIVTSQRPGSGLENSGLWRLYFPFPLAHQWQVCSAHILGILELGVFSSECSPASRSAG